MSPEAKSPAEPSFFPWVAEYLIGNRRFDEEHQRLGAMVAHLHLTMVVRRDREVAAQVFAKLIQETRRHFSNEEDLLTDLGYPDRETHFSEHSRLLEQLNDYFGKYKDGSVSALFFPAFLKAWLITHIHETDRQYVDFLNVHGL